MKTYYRNHPNYGKALCLDCGCLVSHTRSRCRPCDAIRRQGKRVLPRLVVLNCPYCVSEMRLLDWHGRTVARCPGCGLETTKGELQRIASELKVAA